jgi:pimeloyl-ACP methyl ester carboxylesterase
MPTTRVNGHELHYEQRGDGEPLLLIMGMSGTHLTWGESFLRRLEDDWRVTIYDHRGVGKSARAEPGYSIADLADDAAGLLDELGIDAAHVLGISMGGMVAQELTLRHPERVRTLTLGCTYSGGEGSALTTPEVGQRLFGSMQSGDRELAVRTAWEANVSRRFAESDESYATFREAALALPVAVPVIMGQAQAITGHDTLERLGGIEAPTLVIHGTDDEMLPVANGKLIADRIPGAQLEIMDGIGHLFWVEDPDRTVELLREHARAGEPAPETSAG